MLNLHPPFRRTEEGTDGTVTVVAEEEGRASATLSGAPQGATWTIRRLDIAAERLAELGPRILAVADALAADEGLLSVTIEAGHLSAETRALLDQEGFRAGDGPSGELVRPVVPQG